MKLGTPDICDQHRDILQVANPVFKSYGGCQRVAGMIETLKIFRENSQFWEVLRTPGNGRILFVDAAADYGAVMGDKMAIIAVENGWKGIVVNGYIRDIAIIKTLPLAVWALGSCPMKGKMNSKAEQSVALKFHGLDIQPGMFAYADEDGILITPDSLPDFNADFNFEFQNEFTHK
ncbi:putative 4-hydroxy-4-methyl-2-oxoglutarate aldolase [Thiomicrorhabdus hydrogeniphila]